MKITLKAKGRKTQTIGGIAYPSIKTQQNGHTVYRYAISRPPPIAASKAKLSQRSLAQTECRISYQEDCNALSQWTATFLLS
jgi:hypothetical protein